MDWTESELAMIHCVTEFRSAEFFFKHDAIVVINKTSENLN